MEENTRKKKSKHRRATMRSTHCVFCLVRPYKEDEHVLPTSWYPSTTPPGVQRVKVPVCAVCAKDFERAERAFAHPLMMAVRHDNPDAAGIAQAYQRSWQFSDPSTTPDAHHRNGRLRKLMREIDYLPTPLDGGVYPVIAGRTPGGSTIAVSPAFKIDNDACHTIAAKFVRGLHFEELGTPLPLDAKILFVWKDRMDEYFRTSLAEVPEGDRSATWERVATIVSSLPLNSRLAPGLRYSVWREEQFAVWFFTLWGQFEFAAFVSLPTGDATTQD